MDISGGLVTPLLLLDTAEHALGFSALLIAVVSGKRGVIR